MRPPRWFEQLSYYNEKLAGVIVRRQLSNAAMPPAQLSAIGDRLADPILVGKGDIDLYLLPQMANRHGLIAGATGTGKTISLQVLAEGLSRIGVSVFMADVKGDLSGISQPGKSDNPKVNDRIKLLKLQNFAFQGYPVTYWDVLGEQGHPIRATISEMGPLILARLFDVNETQAAVLSLVFPI